MDDAVQTLFGQARDATGADCLSLRLNLPGTGPTAVRKQLARFGTEVLPLLRG